MLRVDRAVRSVGHIGNVHLCRWGDGSEHFHVWFMARPERMPQLAMSFAAQPKLLLLDEPLAGLGPGDSERMVALLASLKGRYAMLLVEHDVEAVFSLADRISVLVAGRIIASGSAAEIRNSAEVRAAYLGEKE